MNENTKNFHFGTVTTYQTESYDDKAPVLMGKRALALVQREFPKLAYNVKFIETAKHYATYRNWANNQPPFNPNGNFAAYWVQETDIRAAAEAFLGVDTEEFGELQFKTVTTDTREIERQPYADNDYPDTEK